MVGCGAVAAGLAVGVWPCSSSVATGNLPFPPDRNAARGNGATGAVALAEPPADGRPGRPISATKSATSFLRLAASALAFRHHGGKVPFLVLQDQGALPPGLLDPQPRAPIGRSIGVTIQPCYGLLASALASTKTLVADCSVASAWRQSYSSSVAKVLGSKSVALHADYACIKICQHLWDLQKLW
eukprot:CAMPEP_0172727404 /NCGR_PEP_ID=MMETSP1074-20121228/91661_1 /TAXON_ID=2916 /ORGANISM="Ceratium fusus, Strain PA161109" /LENGTH=184 /DNA_ID=CAMNT_0013554551 /DNA_START=250 /DNA_END=803 /DNA_ORIENTATION=-